MLSDRARHTRANLQKALPPNEWHAVEVWLGTFFEYQLEWLLDWARHALLSKSRQIGASHTYAGAAVLWGMFGETTTVVSIGQNESNEVIQKAGLHAIALARLGSRWAAPSGEPSTSRVRLRSGGRILGLPSNSGGRGFAGNTILDEFAYHQHPGKVWDGAAATTTHGYRLRVMSTPNGVGNEWHDLVTNPVAHEGYSRHEVTLEQAITQGLKVDIEECWRIARGDPRIFDQFFRCKFLDNNLQYIPSEFLKDALEDYDPADLGDDGDNYAGIDIGESRDRTSLVVLNKQRRQRRLRHAESHAKTDDDLLDDLVDRAVNGFGCRRVCIDATGIGSIPTKRLRKKWGARIEPVEFTLPLKEELATGLYDVLSQNELSMPREYRPAKDAEDEAKLLRDDICAIRRIVTAAGNVRYDAPRTTKGHADRAWALMLAEHAAASFGATGNYGRASARRGRDGMRTSWD